MNEDEDMSADGIAVCSVVESSSEEENDEPGQERCVWTTCKKGLCARFAKNLKSVCAASPGNG